MNSLRADCDGGAIIALYIFMRPKESIFTKTLSILFVFMTNFVSFCQANAGDHRFVSSSLLHAQALYEAIPVEIRRDLIESATANLANPYFCDNKSGSENDQVVRKYLSEVIRTLLNKNNISLNAYPHSVCIHPEWSRSMRNTSYARGLIYLPVPILGKSSFEDQSAFVVAHELSHYLLLHEFRWKGLVANFKEKCIKTMDEESCSEKTANKSDEIFLANEFEADQLAIHLLDGAGFELKGVLDVIRWLWLYVGSHIDIRDRSVRAAETILKLQPIKTVLPYRFSSPIPASVKEAVKSELTIRGIYPKLIEPWFNGT